MILFLKPVFKKKIWGGKKLDEKFSYQTPSNKTGEAWVISAHENGDCEIINGEFKGTTLSNLWDNHRDLFGNLQGNNFPLLVKILDAKDNLSVQVHPDDEYVKEHNLDKFGKTECWYILDCPKDSDLILGHNAKSRDELISMIDNSEWDKLIRKIKINPGDFLYIEPGTVHAICKDTLILEIQQSSDVTFRMYDYNRLQDGLPRELHLEECKKVINVPHVDYKTESKGKDFLVSEKYFTVSKLDVRGNKVIKNNQPFQLVNVISGQGKVNDIIIKKGDNFIITNLVDKIKLSGNLELIITHI